MEIKRKKEKKEKRKKRTFAFYMWEMYFCFYFSFSILSFSIYFSSFNPSVYLSIITRMYTHTHPHIHFHLPLSPFFFPSFHLFALLSYPLFPLSSFSSPPSPALLSLSLYLSIFYSFSLCSFGYRELLTMRELCALAPSKALNPITYVLRPQQVGQ